MKTIICVCFFAVVAVAFARPEEKYTDKYDNTNLDEVLGNDRLLINYFNCIMEKGKCTKEGTELKEHVPDALENKCAKCTDKQKEGVEKVFKHLYNNKHDLWVELTAKYDPNGEYTKKYEEDLKKIKA